MKKLLPILLFTVLSIIACEKENTNLDISPVSQDDFEVLMNNLMENNQEHDGKTLAEMIPKKEFEIKPYHLWKHAVAKPHYVNAQIVYEAKSIDGGEFYMALAVIRNPQDPNPRKWKVIDYLQVGGQNPNTQTLHFEQEDIPNLKNKNVYCIVLTENSSANVRITLNRGEVEEFILSPLDGSYKHVWQRWVATGFSNSNKYTSNSNVNCNYPDHKENGTLANLGTELCGVAAGLIVRNYVEFPSWLELKATKDERAYQMMEMAYQIKRGYNSYTFANTNLLQIRDIIQGTPTFKGELTDETNCSNLMNSGKAVWLQEEVADRNDPGYMKDPARKTCDHFIRDALTNNHPVIVGVKANVKTGGNHPEDEELYFTENPTKLGGHIIVIVGLKVTPTGVGSTVYFKDPLFDDGTTWKVNYTVLLNAIIANSSAYIPNYEALEVKGL